MKEPTALLEKAKNDLAIILDKLKACIARGEKPGTLFEQAVKILISVNSPEIASLFHQIENARKDAVNAYEYKHNNTAKANFDDLLKSNPILAIKLFVEKRKADIFVAKRLAEGLEVPAEEFIAAIRNAQDPKNKEELEKVSEVGVEELVRMQAQGKSGAEYQDHLRNMGDIAILGIADNVIRLKTEENARLGKSTKPEDIHKEHRSIIERATHKIYKRLSQAVDNIADVCYLNTHPQKDEVYKKLIADPENHAHFQEAGNIINQRKRKVAEKIAAQESQKEKKLDADNIREQNKVNSRNAKLDALKARRKQAASKFIEDSNGLTTPSISTSKVKLSNTQTL